MTPKPGSGMAPHPKSVTVIQEVALMSCTHEAILTFDYAFGGNPVKLVVKRTADGFGEVSLSLDDRSAKDGQHYYMNFMPLGTLRAVLAFIDGLPPVAKGAP